MIRQYQLTHTRPDGTQTTTTHDSRTNGGLAVQMWLQQNANLDWSTASRMKQQVIAGREVKRKQHTFRLTDV